MSDYRPAPLYWGPAKYQVEQIGTDYYAKKRSSYGRWRDDEFSDLMNLEVLPGLTAGRTTIETVDVAGNEISVLDPILVEDRTRIRCHDARLDLDADVAAFFSHDNYGDDLRVRDFRLEGGIFNGNKATRASGSCVLGSFHHLYVVATIIVAMADQAIHLTRFGPNFAVLGPRIMDNWIGEGAGLANEGNSQGGLLLDATGNYGIQDGILTDNYFINNGDFNIRAENNCHSFRCLGNHFAGYANAGDGAITSIELLDDIRKWTIGFNHFEQTQEHCIHVLPAAGDFSDGIKIVHNEFYDSGRAADNTYDGIRVDCTAGQSRHGTVIGNFFCNDVAEDLRYAVALIGANANYWTVRHNPIQSNAWQTGDVLSTGANNSVGDNP